MSRLQPAFRFWGSPGIHARAGRGLRSYTSGLRVLSPEEALKEI